MSLDKLFFTVVATQVCVGIFRNSDGGEHAGIVIVYSEDVLERVLAITQDMSRAGETPVVGTDGKDIVVLFKLSKPSKKVRSKMLLADAILVNTPIIMTGETIIPEGITVFEQRFAEDGHFKVSIAANPLEVGGPVDFLWTCELDAISTLAEINAIAMR